MGDHVPPRNLSATRSGGLEVHVYVPPSSWDLSKDVTESRRARLLQV
jgi:hypothetical protein